MDKVNNISENKWLIKMRSRMEQRLRNGQTGYVQIYMERQSYNEPATEEYKYWTLESVYDQFALFSVTTLWGKTRECFSYDLIRETMQEA